MEHAGATTRGATARELLLVAAGFLGITLIVTWPVAARLSTSLPAGLGDPLLNAWTLAWGSDRLAHGLQGFWTPPAFYPYHGALAYSENLLGISLLVAPVQWLGQNLVLTYNVAFLVSFVLAAVGMYLLARELTGRRDAALVAAAVYAFCPYRAAQVTHLQVLMAGWLPIALWALHRFLASARASVLVLFVGAFLLQALSNTYSIVYSLLPIAAIVAWSAVARKGSRRAFRTLAAAGVGLAAMLVPLALRYAAAWRGAPGTRSDIVRYSARLVSLVQVAPEIRYARWLPGGGPDEGNFFPGFIVVGLAVTALLAWWRRRNERTAPDAWMPGVGWPYAAAGLVAALLSLGPEPRAWGRPLPALGWLYEALLAAVPGFAVLRVPARFAMVLMLALAVIAALGAARVLARISAGRWRRLAVAALLAGVVAEGYAGPVRTSDFSIFRDRDEKAVYTALRHRAPTPMLELPLLGLAIGNPTLEYQSATLFHRHPVINGFSRKATPLQDFLGGGASPFATAGRIADGVELLRGLGVEYVVIHPALYRDAALAHDTIEALAGNSKAVVEAWRSRGIAVFRLATTMEAAGVTGHRVPADAITTRASPNPSEVPRAFDHDPATRWATGRPQDGSEWLDLSFDRPRDIVRLDIVLAGGDLGDYPRDLEIVSVEADGTTRPVYRGTMLREIGAALRRDTEVVRARLPLQARAATGLRLRQRGTSPNRWWSIGEIEVWEGR